MKVNCKTVISMSKMDNKKCQLKKCHRNRSKGTLLLVISKHKTYEVKASLRNKLGQLSN